MPGEEEPPSIIFCSWWLLWLVVKADVLLDPASVSDLVSSLYIRPSFEVGSHKLSATSC